MDGAAIPIDHREVGLPAQAVVQGHFDSASRCRSHTVQCAWTACSVGATADRELGRHPMKKSAIAQARRLAVEANAPVA